MDVFTRKNDVFTRKIDILMGKWPKNRRKSAKICRKLVAKSALFLIEKNAKLFNKKMKQRKTIFQKKKF
jgi:hypothetical protein